MKIAVVGTGYVGLVTGTCLAHAGHNVSCVDIDKEKVKKMQSGQIPIYEPGLDDLFKEVLKLKKLNVTTSLAEGVKDAEVIFLALPTPPGADGSADLTAVLNVADKLGPLLKKYTVIVDKSTVPVGTAEQVEDIIKKHTDQQFDVVSNPEFLREGKAVEDFMKPDRIVIGTSKEKTRKIMLEVYKSFIEREEQLIFMDVRSAEMTKYAANTFLAMKISYMNEIANLCERIGANVDSVRLGIGPDKRIGDKFLNAGIGFGGSCFPKDVKALQYTAHSVGYEFKLLNSIVEVNSAQKHRIFHKVNKYYNFDLAGKHFAVWGLSYKPDTDDIRDAPSLDLIDRLLRNGATVAAYDPQARENARRHFGNREGLSIVEKAELALKDADALLIVTEWREFVEANLETMREHMKNPLIFDGRNVFLLNQINDSGFQYSSIGRPAIL